MQLITIGLLAALSAALTLSSTASASSTVPESILTYGCTGPGYGAASLSWSGEDETFASIALPDVAALPELPVNVELMTALAAPEPPAIILAGMALGGLVCGRSLLARKGRNAKKEAV
jgi:hypothetical protein